MIRQICIVFSILFISLILSCASTPLWPEKEIYESAIKPYVQEFSYRSGIPMESLEQIKYYMRLSLPGNAVGVCSITRVPGTPREVSFRLDYFILSSNIQKQAVVFHEILHCYCGRGHISVHGSYWEMFGWKKKSNNDGTCPMSIMYPTLISTECLEQNWEEYMEEAFSTCSKDISIFFHQTR